MGTCKIASTTYNHVDCQVKIDISATQCFTQTASKFGSPTVENSPVSGQCANMHTRVLLLHEAHFVSVHDAEEGYYTAYWCLKAIS